jgi:putative transposase
MPASIDTSVRISYNSYCMKLTAHIRLYPTPEQHAVLVATLERANDLCTTVSATAWQARVFHRLPLQKLVYHDMRESFRLGA